jgi:hypothetical protein
MATSGTYTFNLNTLQIIEMAFQESNIYDLGSTIENEDYEYALKKLNLMLKSWEIKGIRLWKRRQATLFTDANSYSYNIGSVSGSDHCTSSYVNTTLTSTSIIGNNIISVDDNSNFEIGMNIGIEVNDGTRQWSTITTKGVSTISFADTLTVDADSTNTVVAYTSKINRPLEIIRATSCDLKNNNSEVQIGDISYDEYFNMPLKTTVGRPCNFYYDRLINNSLPYTGTLYLFPCPDTCSTVINFSYYDCIQDIVNSNETVDLPQEWLPAIYMGLAAELCIPYDKTEKLQMIKPIAEQLRAELESFDSDIEDLNIGIDNK